MFVTVICPCAVAPTLVTTVALLLAMIGSITDELTTAVLLIVVPFATPVFTLTTNVKLLEDNPARFTSVHTTLPALPTLGTWQLQPAGVVSETKVVFVGADTTIVALSAALGPLSVATTVYVMLLPLATGFGDAASVTAISALETTFATSVDVSFSRFASPPPEIAAMLVNVAGADCETRAFKVIAG